MRIAAGLVLALGFLVFGCVPLPKTQPTIMTAGGTEITFRIKPDSMAAYLKSHPAESEASVQAEVLRIIDERVAETLGVVGGSVKLSGDKIVVELPGFHKVAEARRAFAPARVVLYHAKNVTTSRSTRPYTFVKSDLGPDGHPETVFARASGEIRFNEDPVKGAAYRKMIDGWTVLLEGADIADASVTINRDQFQPEFQFSAEGASKLEAFCKRYLNQGENLAFVVDGQVLQLAPLQDGVVLKDSAFIDGDFDPQFVKILTRQIKAGALPVELEEVDYQEIGEAAVKGR